MTKIPYANENRSKFIPLIKDQLVDFNGNIEISIKDIKGRGYPGKFLIDISPNDDFFVVADFQNKDKTRFPQRIKATATALKLLGHEGRYNVSHKNGVITIERGLKNLRLNGEYSREDIHAVFSPETKFTPSAGTWGLHGIIPIPNRENDFVFIVTYGQSVGMHTFDEGITTDGVLSWQSQPSNKLSDLRISKLINHDEINDNIYLFLREEEGLDYEYLGKLKYLSHDKEREMPVYFQWQLLDWHKNIEGQNVGNNSSEEESLPLGILEPTTNKPTKKTIGTTVEEFRARKSPDYALKEQKNKRLGDLGEKLVLRYEREYLISSNRRDLADQIIHVSEVEGDGAGYDIKSFDLNESVKYIEVKTTRGDINTDFFMSPREINFSKRNKDNFYLYRVFDLTKKNDGKVYVIQGDVTKEFDAQPTGFKLSKR